MSILLALIVLSVVVVVHEWGHFYAARKCGILVEEFAIGMGPKLFSIKPGETVYSIRLFPIGGSCRMLGEETAADDERAYNNKPVWKRMIVILAGVIMNFVLAFVIAAAVVFFIGFYEPVVAKFSENSSAQAAGLMVNDRIVRANGTAINTQDDFAFFMAIDADGSPINIEVIRDNKPMQFSVTPKLDKDGYKLGFYPNPKLGIFADKGENSNNLQTAGFGESIIVSGNTTSSYVKSVLGGLSGLFTEKVKMDDMAGFVGIVTIIGDSYEKSVADTPENPRTAADKAWTAFWNLLQFAALISANLAVINLLPIPVMDGGRMVFLVIEAIRRKPMNPEREGMIQMASFVLLMILMVVFVYNDIMKLIL